VYLIILLKIIWCICRCFKNF